MMSDPRLIGDIMNELNAMISSGEPVHVGGFVCFVAKDMVRVLTEAEYKVLRDGDDSDSDE